jgi:hypothetical protein
MKAGMWLSIIGFGLLLHHQALSQEYFLNSAVPQTAANGMAYQQSIRDSIVDANGLTFGSTYGSADGIATGNAYGDSTYRNVDGAATCNDHSSLQSTSRRNGLADFYAGYSFAFTKLHLKESFEAQVFDLGTLTQRLVPFEYDYELTPRIWVGLRNQAGIGFRSSYWSFDHQSSGFEFINSTGLQVPVATSTSVIFPAAISGSGFGDTLTVGSSVKASTLDFEGTYATNMGVLSTEFGGGIRYARSDQNSNATVTPGPTGSFARLNWQRVFEGIGPAFSANGTLPIGNRGFYGVGGANASFLFGEKAIRRAVVNDSTPPANLGLPLLLFEEADEISGIYGLRIGLGLRRQTVLGDAFVEGTYEGQLWTDLGAPTLTFAGFNTLSLNLGLTF